MNSLTLVTMEIGAWLEAYLCPNMINFDGVNFSERRSEEVISFF